MAVTCISLKAQKDDEREKETQSERRKQGKSQREVEQEEQMEGENARQAVRPVKLLTSWCEPAAPGDTGDEWTYLA